MSLFRIEGGHRLNGEITLQGSKNSALPILAASLLINGQTILHNCPDLSDVRAAIKILQSLGCKCHYQNSDVYIDSSSVVCNTVPDHLMREMRSSVVFLGAILARCSAASITAPGGCELGPRPIDLHLKAIKELGFSVDESLGVIKCTRCESPERIELSLDFPSVGATENIILASVLSKSTVILHNAAREPEISDLADFLNKAGGKIKGAGAGKIEICGVERLHSCEHTVIPDRIAAATYMSAAAVTRGSIYIKNVNIEHIKSIISSFREIGCKIQCYDNSLKVITPAKLSRIKSLRSTVYPGFPTDAGPLLIATLVSACGTSTFVETIFENRFNYIGELKRLGADIKTYDRVAVVEGVPHLYGAKLSSTDLRGGAAAIVAALSAEGISTVDKIYHIERGYEDIAGVLSSLNAKIIKE